MALTESELVRFLLAERAKLMAYVLSIVRDRHLAEDVFQEVSVLALEKCGEIQSVAATPAWLFRAARLVSLAAMRQSRKKPQPFSNDVLDGLDEVWASHADTPSASMADALENCLQHLTARSQQIVALRYRDGLRSGAIAERLQSNRNTIYVTLGRIHRALRECLQRRLPRRETKGIADV